MIPSGRWLVAAVVGPFLLVTAAIGWMWWLEYTDPTPVRDVEVMR